MIIAYLLPLASAVLYTFATIFTKKAIENGAGIIRANFVTNAFAAGFLLLLMFVVRPEIPDWRILWAPLFCGTLYFIGQIFIFVSIRTGDVTIQVPLLGIKVVFVSLFVAMFTDAPVPAKLIAASCITTFAVFMLGLSNVKFSKQTLYTIGLVVAANLAYALSDCFIQMHMEPIGVIWFVAVMYWTSMALNFALIPFFRAPLSAIPKPALKWIAAGGSTMFLQGFMLVVAMGVFKIATVANIIYSTRGLWSIVIVWFVGGIFGIHEKNIGRKLMTLRLAGASLLLLAVFVALY